MRKLIFIMILHYCIGPLAEDINGQEKSNKSGTTAAQFLKIGVGARAMGQGGSFVAQADDAYSLYWNPAGITKLKGVTFAAVHTQWFADITHQFFGLILPVNSNSAVGFQATVLNMDQIEITTIDSLMDGLSEVVKAKNASQMEINRKGLEMGAKFVLKGA